MMFGRSMNVKNFIFDLDGTLTDSGEGITKSVRYALKRYGIETDSLEELEKFIGPPLKDSFMKYYDFSEEEALRAVEAYREYYTEKGLYQNRPYPLIRGLLERADDKNLYVATSKPEVFARRVLEYFHLDGYFDDIVGASLDGNFIEKEEIIEKVMKDNHLKPEETVMIGDREHDILGGKKNGLFTVGALYGYGSREELENAGADRIFATVEELTEFVLKEV